MTISSSMLNKRLQPPIPTLFRTHKLRSLDSLSFGSKPAAAPALFTISSVNSSSSNLYSTCYLNYNVGTRFFSALTTRCFHIVDTTDSEPWDYDDDEAANGRGYYAKSNALLSKGPRGTFVTKKSEEGMYVRVDIPGVGTDGVKVGVENGSILCFGGKGLREKYMGPRTYAGGFICCTDTYNLRDVRAFLRNGVLRMMIPKKKSSFNSPTKVAKLILPPLTKVASTATSDTNIADDHKEEDDNNDATTLEVEKWTEKHPFQTSGPRRTWVVKRIDEALLLRFDMPGVGEKDFKVWMNNDTVFYEGKAPKVSEHEDGRQYSGTLVLRPGWCNKEGVWAEVYNGVIKITMPSMNYSREEGCDFDPNRVL